MHLYDVNDAFNLNKKNVWPLGKGFRSKGEDSMAIL